MIDLPAYRRWRADRAAMFGPLVVDPAWDMLLALLDDEQRGRSTRVSSLCHASLAPATTALRHIDNMIDAGLARRAKEGGDRRCVLIRLTHEGRDKVSSCLARLHKAGLSREAKDLARAALERAVAEVSA